MYSLLTMPTGVHSKFWCVCVCVAGLENAKERQMYLRDVSSDGPCTKGVNSAAATKKRKKKSVLED